MTTLPRDWDRLSATWLGQPVTSADLEAMLDRSARTRRALRLLPLLSLGVTAISLAFIAAALRHAGNVFESTLGMLVGLGICVAWMADLADRRLAVAAVEANPETYAAVRRIYCGRRLRFARFGQIVALLDLVFLTPWWIGGIKVHGVSFAYMQVLSVWIPLAIIIGFIAWTRRVSRRARAELSALSPLSELP